MKYFYSVEPKPVSGCLPSSHHRFNTRGSPLPLSFCCCLETTLAVACNTFKIFKDS